MQEHLNDLRSKHFYHTSFQVCVAEKFRVYEGLVIGRLQCIFPKMTRERRFDLGGDGRKTARVNMLLRLGVLS
jgi:hypothetical protein